MRNEESGRGGSRAGERGSIAWRQWGRPSRWSRWNATLAVAVALLLSACSDPVASENGSGGEASVTFSHEAGFYAQPFALALSTALEDATIYYTLDGSLPDPERVLGDSEWEALPAESRARTFVYSEPIDLGGAMSRPNDIVDIPTTHTTSGEGAWRAPPEAVQKAVPVRAVAVDGSTGSIAATSATGTYFIVPEGRARYSFPVVSLSMDRASLFASDSGIYVPGATGENFHQRGEEWERLAHFELFDVAGQRPVAQQIGVRIHGGWTRHFAQKSLRLYSRSDYGTSRFSYRFFPSKDIDDFNRLILRNSGNDWGRTMFRDAALQTLVQHLTVDTQHYQPAILFINGEYWGIHNLRDRFDQHYLETHYDIPRDEVTILEGGGDVTVGENGDDAPYREFLSAMRGGAFSSFEDFDEYMDVTGYLDYVIVQWYAANTDWPHNNVDWWRYKGSDPTSEQGPRDGRWRWLLYDVDRSFGYHSSETTNMVEHMFENGQYPWATELFRGMMQVPEIRHEFLQRSAVHAGTTFDPDHVRAHISSMAQVVQPEMSEHVRRWGRPESVQQWNSYVDRMLDFASARPSLLLNHIVGYFGDVQGTAEVSIRNLPGGGVTLHTVELSAGTPGVTVSGGQWTGTLFTGIPVVLTSTDANLSQATVSGSAQNVEATADTLRFILTGPAQVDL